MSTTTTFTLVTILVALGYFQSSTAEITVKDIRGKWYVPALVAPIEMSGLSCLRRHVTEGADDHTFEVTDTFMNNGSHQSYDGIGKIQNSTEMIEYKKLDKESFPGVMTSYNNGQSIIIRYETKEGHLYVLHSRKSTADDKTLNELERIAKDIKYDVTEIRQENCS